MHMNKRKLAVIGVLAGLLSVGSLEAQVAMGDSLAGPDAENGERVTLSAPAPTSVDLTPPVVAKPVPAVAMAAGAAARVVNLAKTFALKGVTQEVVRFTTTLGNVDVELYPASTPKTVANFLSYVDRGEGASGGYDGTLLQRSIPGFVLQGGGYYIANDNIETLTPRAAIASEAGIRNTTGTIAMALSTGPNSATSAWFFNLADNTDLDNTSDGGPFTVFGRVIEAGMNTIDAIVALKTYDLSASLGDAFENVPLVNYNPAVGASSANLVYVKHLATIPLTPAAAGGTALLALTVVNNSKPGLVKATLVGEKLKLKPLGKETGIATITLQAKDSAGTKVKTKFTVTVQ
jgi:cyclophilin family peptidyl-prolyl cis-trans isomerase